MNNHEPQRRGLRPFTAEELKRGRLESKRKAELDHRWQLNSERSAGREEGREAGGKLILISQINKLQTLLQLAITPDLELSALSLTDLERRNDELLARLQAKTA